jgi:hypothetical protein
MYNHINQSSFLISHDLQFQVLFHVFFYTNTKERKAGIWIDHIMRINKTNQQKEVKNQEKEKLTHTFTETHVIKKRRQ